MHVKLRSGFIARERARARVNADRAFWLACGKARQRELRAELEAQRAARKAVA